MTVFWLHSIKCCIFYLYALIISCEQKPANCDSCINMAMIIDSVVSMMLQGAVSSVKAYLENMGLGHWAIESWNLENTSEVPPEIFNCNAFVNNFLFTGLSDFVVNDLKFSLEASKLCFDISIPELKLCFGKCGGMIKVLGSGLDGELKGKINIVKPRIIGELYIEMSDEFGYSLNQVDAQFLLGSIKSNLKIKINNTSYNKVVNDFLSKSVPVYIAQNNAQLNVLLNLIIKLLPKVKTRSSAVDTLF